MAHNPVRRGAVGQQRGRRSVFDILLKTQTHLFWYTNVLDGVSPDESLWHTEETVSILAGSYTTECGFSDSTGVDMGVV